MPHTRKLRDLDWEPSNEDFPEALASQDDRSTAEELAERSSASTAGEASSAAYEGYEAEGDSGASWLANDVIIGSLPDNKLRDALARYRAIVRLCEAELVARSVSPRRGTKPSNHVSFMDQYPAYKLPPKADRVPARRSRRSRKQTAPPLAPEQLLKALEMLLKLKSQKDKQSETCQIHKEK